MKQMSVREIRLKWPQAEQALATEGEIIVTRDSKPVARILPYRATRPRRRKRFDPAEQRRWLARFWKRQPAQPGTGELLERDRSE